MKTNLFIVLFLLFNAVLQAQPSSNPNNMNKYTSQWKQVEKLERDDLPKSAIEEVDKILQQSIKEKNTQQAIKAMFYKYKYKAYIDSGDNANIFIDLENLLNNTTSIEDKSILHSILGELYLQYYQNESWNIDRRTNLQNYIPTDMQEWTKNIFFDKIIEHLNLSVSDKNVLIKTNTKIYDDIIISGDDSKDYYPTLYDFLMKRAIDLSKNMFSSDINRQLSQKNITYNDLIETNRLLGINLGKSEGGNELTPLAYYQKYILSLTERNMVPTLILTELDMISYLGDKSSIFANNNQLDALLALENKYSNHPTSVEIIDEISSYYNNRQYYYSINEEIQQAQAKAYEWLKKGIDKFPDYKRTDVLKAILSAMEYPLATITGSQIFHPDQSEKTLKIKYRNLNKITLKINRKSNGTSQLVKTVSIDLTPTASYLTEEKEFILDLNETGEYEITPDFDKKKSNNSQSFTIYISQLYAFSRLKGENEYEFYVVDRLSGKPIQSATISINKNNSLVKELKTDNSGFAIYQTEENFNKDYSLRSSYTYNVSLGNDKPQLNNQFPYRYSYSSSASPENKSREKISIFTDRSIYRPGQTVYFKGVVVNTINNDHPSPVINKNCTVRLYNVNDQIISEKTLQTNEFGSVAGEFILPQNTLTGSYSIGIENQRKYISIEEYKRPTFQITFEPLEGSYTFGEKVIVKGNAETFSGIKLQNSIVEYTITKNHFWRWMGSNEQVSNGSVEAKDDGSFQIEFTIPEDKPTNIPYWKNIYNFDIIASITDINGETQTGNYSFAVGSVSMLLSINIPDKMKKNSIDSIKIEARNLNGKETQSRGNYIIYNIPSNDTTRNEVRRGSFITGIQPELKNELRKLPSGQYKIVLKASDSNNREVENEATFILYSNEDKRPPMETNEWFIINESSFNEKKNAEIVMGVSAKESTILYEIMKGNKIYERQQVKLSNENKKFIIPYKPEYEENVYACFTYVINEKAYQKNILISKAKIEKNLYLKFEVFRDKLRPGQNEEWKISVKDATKNPVFAELLASMYDMSLDKISPVKTWNLNIFSGTSYRYPEVFSSYNFSNELYANISFQWASPQFRNLNFDRLNWFDFYFGSRYRGMRAVDKRLFTGASGKLEAEDIKVDGINDIARGIEGRAASVTPQYLSGVPNASPQEGKLEESLVVATGGGNNNQPQIRQNFNETAFFYPQLKTNKDGETIISFIVPESNTTWRFRALAYDKSLNTGMLEAISMSQKELMVTPNLPRFMRQGDRTSISTKISNLSENSISGSVRIEFFDPVTENIINLSVPYQSQNFSLEKDASNSVEWIFNVPENIEMIGCRIVAKSENFSDGEQHAISILPNKMLVTESMTMNANSPGTKEFKMDKLLHNTSETLTNYRLTLEYSVNPAWYAVQALPVLSNPTNENAVNWFASYYANTLGSFITQQYPTVSAMISAWKKQGETKESITSKLMKNEELKSVLLEETPWVLEAKNETEQMQRLSLLLDLNNTRQQTTLATDKLEELQNYDGGWSWYKGFSSNRSITQYILYGFTELISLNAVQYPENVKRMQMNAIRYIDEQILKDFQDLKKNNKDWQKISSISTNQLEYMYVRSSYRDIPINQETREAERFYYSIVEKNWTKLNLYERSLLAVLSKRNGNNDLSLKIINSLRERASINEEMGMYWANNRSSVFVSLSAVSAHVFIMDAFKETNSASEEEMNLMKLWLLKQKQTQMWESTHATADAIYALLSTGSNWFDATSDNVRIIVGNEEIIPENKKIGTGYFKETWERNEIINSMGNITISKSGNQPSYGALYWQYYENLDKISNQSGELNVEKKLFIEKTVDNGKSLVQITETNPVNVGDKVIMRLTVRVDRDMEFVHLKDMRASCFEPIETISGTKWQNDVPYYQSTKDASTNFYFDHLPKGTYVFEYPVYANRKGSYSNGITSIQCLYAPEFISHTSGINIIIE